MSPCHCMTQLALMPKPEAALLGNALQGLINTRNRPKSGLDQAFHYPPRPVQWPAMQAFLEDGHVEIDDNDTENQDVIRLSAVSEKK